MPLKGVKVKSELLGAIANISIELTYVNPSETSPLECTYLFPIDPTHLVTKFEVLIDDRTISTKVTDKEAAENRYDDSIAGGNMAVIAKREETEDGNVMRVCIGNLAPG